MKKLITPIILSWIIILGISVDFTSHSQETDSRWEVWNDKNGSYEEDLKIYLQKVEEYKKANNKLGLAYILWTIGETNRKIGNYSKSLKYFEQSNMLYNELEFETGMINCLISYGHLYSDAGDHAKGLKYIQNAITLIKKNGLQSVLASTYSDLGEKHHRTENLDSALFYYLLSLSLLEELGEEELIADVNRKIGVLPMEQKASKYLYQAYMNSGQDELALKYLERLLALEDSLQTGDAYLELQHMEFEQQRRADSLATEEANMKKEIFYQAILGKEKRVRNGIMFAGIGMLLLTGAIFNRMIHMRRTKKELEQKNEQIVAAKEQAEASEKAKEEFFNNVSHEFRTPLTLILGPLKEVIDTTTDYRIKPGLEIMERNVARLQEMINELLDLSKLEYGKMKLKAREENIVKLTEEYLQSFESLADQRNVRLRFESDATHYHVWIDAEKYRKIMSNLLSNAFKHTPAGGRIVVSIGCIISSVRSSQLSGTLKNTEAWRKNNQDMETACIIISVSDTGDGISKEHLPYIFERFYCVDESNRSGVTGTGIGLALTKELVEMHHGSLEVSSQKGKGTTFVVILPLGKDHLMEQEIDRNCQSKDDSAIINRELEIGSSKHGTFIESPLLLIVEDNTDMRAYIRNQFQNDYKIMEAGDGEAGFQVGVVHVPDLVVSDVMMPRVDGYIMTEKLKLDPRTNHIPVVLLTARASVESRIEGLETGADAYITKPFDPRELKVRVKMLIEQRIRLREHFRQTFESPDDYLAKDPQLPSMDQRFVQRAIDIVEKHLENEHLNTCNFATEMALSRVQLHRKIRALTGKSTTEFIRTIRLNKASILLRNHVGNVTEIAYQVGFSSLSYFTSTFTEQFGLTPSEFIKKHQVQEVGKV